MNMSETQQVAPQVAPVSRKFSWMAFSGMIVATLALVMSALPTPNASGLFLLMVGLALTVVSWGKWKTIKLGTPIVGTLVCFAATVYVVIGVA